jgi:hypothetical protein
MREVPSDLVAEWDVKLTLALGKYVSMQWKNKIALKMCKSMLFSSLIFFFVFGIIYIFMIQFFFKKKNFLTEEKFQIFWGFFYI